MRLIEPIPWRFIAGPGGFDPEQEEPGDHRDSDSAPVVRIVIVEDELMVAWSLETTVEEMGHQVVGMFADGETALAAIGAARPDLVLMDINLGGGIDGVETARRIRTEHKAPILFISAYSDVETKARVEMTVPGAMLLRKPVPPERLGAAIEQATRRLN